MMAPLSPIAHNLHLSHDGKIAFMAPNGKNMSIGDVETGQTLRTITFTDNVRPFVVNKDSTRIYANINNLNGFEIADVATGKIIAHVPVEHTNWREKWNATPRPRIPHACPSHGIALVNDENWSWRMPWLADSLADQPEARERASALLHLARRTGRTTQR